MLFQVKARWSADVKYEVNLDAALDSEPYGVRLGAAMKAALKSGSDLSGSDLSGSDLSRSNLTLIRDDFWSVLSACPKEIAGLRAALIEGRVDGSAYAGDCACLVGTLANVRGCEYDEIPNLRPNSSRPAEAFFMGIRKGSTPENNQQAAIAVEWLDQWVAGVKAAFAPVSEVSGGDA